MLKAPTSFRARTLSTESRDGAAADTHSTDVARRRTQRKDETIRKRTEQELLKLKPGRRGRDKTPPRLGGTVGNLRPLSAIILSESETAYDAARFMTVKRADAVLVTDANEQLSGIVTDKDLAFRVIAEGLDPHNTYLGEIMTRNPCTVTTAHNATDALNEMVNGGFRHLPVTDSRSNNIVGILDITECLLDALAKLERANRSTKQLTDVLETMSEFETTHNREVTSYVRVLREQLGFPQLHSILDPTKPPAEVSIRTNVREIARVMKEKHQTAVLVVDEERRTVGIFTSKDLLVRVIAGKLEPGTTSAVRVMTPNPDMASPETTILDALRTMQEGRYQHLPLSDANGIVGIVDILQLTYATLRTLQHMEGQEGDGPVWNKFWNAVSLEDASSERTLSDQRVLSSGGSAEPSVKEVPIIATTPPSERRYSELESRVEPAIPGLMTYKFKDPQTGQTHRFSSACGEYSALSSLITQKMSLRNGADLSVSYVDDENDKVALSCNEDLINALELAQRSQWSLIRLYVKMPENVKSEARGLPQKNGDVSKEYMFVSGGSFAVGVAVGGILTWALKK